MAWPSTLLIRSAAFSASSTPRRSETRTPNSLPPVRARTSPARSARISRRAKVISNSSPARPPIDSLIREKRSMSTTSTAWSTLRDGCLARFLDGFGEGQPVGQAGQAVAQHLGAKVVLRLHLDGAVDDAQQAARRRRMGLAASGDSFNFRKRRPNALAFRELDLVTALSQRSKRNCAVKSPPSPSAYFRNGVGQKRRRMSMAAGEFEEARRSSPRPAACSSAAW